MQSKPTNFLTFFLIGLAAVVVGSLGHWYELCDLSGFERYYSAVYASLLMLAFVVDPAEDTNFLVHIARILAIVAVWGAIVRAIFNRFSQQRAERIAQRWSDHTVVIGLGDRGFQFAQSALQANVSASTVEQDTKQLLVITPEIDSAAANQLRQNGAVVIEGYGQDKALLKRYGVDRAELIVAITRDDATNIEIGHAVKQVFRNNKAEIPSTHLLANNFACKPIARAWLKTWSLLRRILPAKWLSSLDATSPGLFPSDKFGPSHSKPAKLFLHIDDRLLRQTLRDQDDCTQPAKGRAADGDSTTAEKNTTTQNLSLEPFSGRELAVAEWFRDAQLHYFAKLHGRNQLHLVVVGFDNMASEVVRAFTLLYPCPGFNNKPILSLLLPDGGNADPGRLAAGHRQLLSQYPALPTLLDIKSYAFDPAHSVATDKLLQAVELNGSVSAIIVCQPNDNLSSSLALKLRRTTRQLDRWRAPIYVHIRKRSGLEGAICTANNAKRLSEVVEPFGTLDSACTHQALVRFQDEIPSLIHKAYRKQSEKKPREQRPSHCPWDQLIESHRASNRRQADHIPVKLSHLGLVRSSERFDFQLPVGYRIDMGDALENLAEAEHNSWLADRQLDGWIYSGDDKLRDDSRRLHNTIVPYDQLSEEYKDYDRETANLLIGDSLMSTSQSPTWRPKVVIALIGHNRLNEAQATKADTKFRTVELPKLLEKHAKHRLCFVTPLAPGSDLILAQAVLDQAELLKQQNTWDNEIRLCILEAVPRPFVVEDYRNNFVEKQSWPSTEAWNQQHRTWKKEEKDQGEDARYGRDFVLQQLQAVEENDNTDWIIELSQASTTLEHWLPQSARDAGYLQAAGWMLARADELVAIYDKDRDGSSKMGTHATLDKWNDSGKVQPIVIQL